MTHKAFAINTAIRQAAAREWAVVCRECGHRQPAILKRGLIRLTAQNAVARHNKEQV